MKMILSIALGGAIGAVGRYLAMSGVGHWLGTAFPYGTLVVNVAGSFVLGALVEIMALAWSPGSELRALIVVGILGAFTTFSTFSLDVVLLFERGALSSAAIYILTSVAFSIAAFMAGMYIFRHILA
jgi:CrcB protein